MNGKLMQVSCAPECGFMIQSHDEKELMEMVKTHAYNAHQMKMSDEEVKDKMEMVN